MADLVTGEAVVLELRLAKLASRALGLAIDLTIQIGALLLGALLLSTAFAGLDAALSATIALVGVIVVTVGYPVAFETLTRGRTAGKLVLGLRVVRDDGGPVRFRHSLMRGLVGFVEIWLTFGSLALITSLFSAKGKRLGDYAAGTVVVRERMPVQGGPVAAMPPGLGSWAAGLELSRLPGDVALSARQFLGRANDLAPDVRASMGARLATSVASYVAPAPPPGVPPEAYLAAVLAERRNRDLARLQPQPAYGGGWPTVAGHPQQAPGYRPPQPGYAPPQPGYPPPPPGYRQPQPGFASGWAAYPGTPLPPSAAGSGAPGTYPPAPTQAPPPDADMPREPAPKPPPKGPFAPPS